MGKEECIHLLKTYMNILKTKYGITSLSLFGSTARGSQKAYLCTKLKNKMSDDISQSVSQRGRGEEIAENRRIYEVSDELYRRCQLYEAQLRDGQENVSRFEAEQRVAEQYAKENGMWVPNENTLELTASFP